jgi:hypothetical protein
MFVYINNGTHPPLKRLQFANRSHITVRESDAPKTKTTSKSASLILGNMQILDRSSPVKKKEKKKKKKKNPGKLLIHYIKGLFRKRILCLQQDPTTVNLHPQTCVSGFVHVHIDAEESE